MAGAIGVAAVLLARTIQLTCPHCGHVVRVERWPAVERQCPQCKRSFLDLRATGAR